MASKYECNGKQMRMESQSTASENANGLPVKCEWDGSQMRVAMRIGWQGKCERSGSGMRNKMRIGWQGCKGKCERNGSGMRVKMRMQRQSNANGVAAACE